jgi:hypothetical protein
MPNQMPNLRGLIFGLAHTRISTAAVQISTVVASAGLLLWTVTRRNGRRILSAPLAAITVAVLVSYHLLIHDLSVMFVPILCALDRFILQQEDGNTIDKWLTRSAAVAFCAPIAESFFPDHLYLVCVPLLIFLAFLLERPMIGNETHVRRI